MNCCGETMKMGVSARHLARRASKARRAGHLATAYLNDLVEELTESVVKAPLNSYYNAPIGGLEHSRERLDSPSCL